LFKKATLKEIASLVLNNRVLLKASKEMNFLFCVPQLEAINMGNVKLGKIFAP